MIRQILDLHTHSKYSRACSKTLELPIIAKACKVKGIDIVSTGDFTHPKWFKHLKESLVEENEGIYKLTSELSSSRQYEMSDSQSFTRFLFGTEVACIKKHKDKTRRIHALIFCSSSDVAETLNKRLSDDGFNLNADGRPILGMSIKTLLEYIKNIDDRCHLIPAHAWTPWFGIFGSNGGYDSLEEAFDELSTEIFAIETGLSSDPLMNWRVSALDDIALVSNSDAHSPEKLGREANVLQFFDKEEITYDGIFDAIRSNDINRFSFTIEFYPEEGKYHFDGHKDCNISFHPYDTKKYKGICPKCKKPLVIGVMNRVMKLSDRTESEAKVYGKNSIPYRSLVPLAEIIANTVQKGWRTKTVQNVYSSMIKQLGSEFYILLDASLSDIACVSTSQVAEAVDRVRHGNIFIRPGYDGEFGIIKIFTDYEYVSKIRQQGLRLS